MLNKYIIALVAGQYSILTSARPVAETPTVVVNDAGPATYTANPSIGGGGSSFKDSAHFRVYDASTSAADATLRLLEAAHSCFVETLGWRTPALSWTAQTDSAWYKTNVYSKKASELPGAAGVQGADPVAGLAWLEVVDSYLTDPSVTVHEYGHALSVAEKNWINQGRTGAWWEPIANYIADAYISTPTCASSKSAQGFSASEGASIINLNTVIGNSFQVIVDGTSGSGNYYESWPFIAYLNNNPDNYQKLGKDTLLKMMRNYTIDSNDTPLHALSKLLGTEVTVQQVVGRYWAHMAYVDIGHAKAHEAFVAQQRSLTYGNLDANGAVKSARAPRYMGANIIPLKVTGTTVTVAITSSGQYTATLVVNSAGKITYTDVVDGKGSVTVASSAEVSLVVANTPALVQYDAFAIPADLNKGLQYSVKVTGASF
ncbi:Nn.00g064000.m01.CDS01 [Neocucurbitaria sp. VM-36]